MKYIIEHLEDEVTEWCCLEYLHMMKFLPAGSLIISGVSDASIFPPALQSICRPLSFLSSIEMSKVVLLDPKAEQELVTEDGETYEYLLFGGILVSPLHLIFRAMFLQEIERKYSEIRDSKRDI
jgi:ribosome biogenesis SPOUT family RNA methylase Rps3